MAGFFGLFNYEKEGPGVSKEEPKKRGMFAFFELYFSHIWQLITVNCWLSILTLPVLTNGLGRVGITYVCRTIGRRQHSFGTHDFFDSIKKNLKQGLIAGIVNTVITVILSFSLYYYFLSLKNAKSGLSIESLCFGIVLFMIVMFNMMNYYLWTLVVTYNFKLFELYKNSFKLAVVGMKRNLLITVVMLPIYAIGILLYFYCGIPGASVAIVLSITVIPSFRFFLIQYNVFPIIKKVMIDPYYAKHPGEDIEKRKALGLDFAEGELPEEREDSLFMDTTQVKNDKK